MEDWTDYEATIGFELESDGLVNYYTNHFWFNWYLKHYLKH